MQNHELKPFLTGLTTEELKMFVADFWERGGWRVDRVWTNDSAKVDIYIEHPQSEHVIGMEILSHQSSALSEKDVKDCFYRFAPKEWADIYCIFSTAEFNRSAKRAARTVGCDLVDLSAFTQAIVESGDRVLCAQYDDRHYHIGSAEDLNARFKNIGVVVTATAREVIMDSEVREALIYAIETAENPELPLNIAHIHALEDHILEERPSRPYPVSGGYAPAWQSR